MNAMDRAKAFLKGRAKQTALTIVPLALAAMNAYAGVILDPSLNSGSGIFDGSSINVGSVSTLQLAPVGGITGVKGWGNGTTTFSGGGFIQMIMSGTLSGSIDANTIVGFNTTFSASEFLSLNASGFSGALLPGNTYLYLLTGNIFFSDSALDIVSTGGNGSFFGSVSDQLTSITLDLSQREGLTPTGWSSTLTVCLDDGTGACAVGGPQLALAVPQNSMDVTGAATTPEPSTWLLLSSGLGGLLFFGKRRA